MPSQEHQVMSQNTAFGGNPSRPDPNNQTTNTDHNLQENFKSDGKYTAYQRGENNYNQVPSQETYQKKSNHHQNSSIPTL
jgi:hypothetical protein